MNTIPKHTFQHWRASVRDTTLLLREFGSPLIFFVLVITGGGAAYFFLARAVGEPVDSMPEAVYSVLTMAFLQASGDFPHHPLMQVFYFLMPIIGIGALAQGLTDFGILLFNRRARSREWEIAVASTLNKHNILVGLGHLGFRVVQQLHEMGEQVTVIELDPKADLTAAVQKMSIPVISGDASRGTTLIDANVKDAKSIILCVQNDAVNLKTALKARTLNPDIKVIIRIFDNDFAEELHSQFGFNALSGTAIAAPAFAASAAGADITNPINIEGESLSLARLTVAAHSELDGKTVGQIEDGFSVSLVLVRQNQKSILHPTDSLVVKGTNTLVVLGRPEKLNALVQASR